MRMRHPSAPAERSLPPSASSNGRLPHPGREKRGDQPVSRRLGVSAHPATAIGPSAHGSTPEPNWGNGITRLKLDPLIGFLPPPALAHWRRMLRI